MSAAAGSCLRYPGPVRAWWTVAVLSLAGIVSYTDRLILSTMVDPIRHSLGLDDTAVSLLQGLAFVVVYITSSLLFGWLADRSHRLILLLFGSILWSLATAAGAVATSFASLFLARVCVGFGEAALLPAAVSILSDTFPARLRGTAIGLFMVGFLIGGPASITVGGTLLSIASHGDFAALPVVGEREPWRQVLFVVGLAGLCIPVALLTLREPRRMRESAARHTNNSLLFFRDNQRRFLPIYLAVSLLAIGDYGALSWMPTMLSRVFALPTDQIGREFGAITISAGIVGCLLGGRLSDLAGAAGGVQGRMVLGVLGAAAAASSGLLVLVPDTWAPLAGMGLWTFASALGAMTAIASIQAMLPGQYRGRGVSLITFCTTLLGLGLGPVSVAVLTDTVFRDPAAIGASIATLELLVGACAALLFVIAAKTNGSAAQSSGTVP